jgi:hypothetical protein
MGWRSGILLWAVGVVLAITLVLYWFSGTVGLDLLWLIGMVFLSMLFASSAEWHSKQTMVIETPAGEVSSSAVRGRQMWEEPFLHRTNSDDWGEALAIEVAPGRYLFAVIEENKPWDVVMFGIPGSSRIQNAHTLAWMKGDPREIPPDQYPPMVTFGDLKDPSSVIEVDPFNLPATFGAGYRIKSYTLEITDEPVTEGRVDALLPWLPDYYNMRLDGRRYGTSDATNRLANSLASGSFDAGER